jgi:osmotically-inducible protein OsmY
MTMREDERIEGDVNERLSTELPDDAAQIQVNVTHGEVTLAGTVDTSEPGAGPKTSPGASPAWSP